MTRILAGSGVVLAVLLIGGSSAGAQAPQPPKSVPEAPAMGGQPQTKSSRPVIALRANEVALSRVAHASLVHNATKPLGDVSRTLYRNEPNEKANVPEKIGTLTTALLDPSQKKVTAVGVDTGANRTAELPWSQIEPIHQPHDQFQTAMTAQAIVAESQKPAGNKAIDVEQAFIGRPVVDANGKTVGTVSDVVAQIESGTLDYIVVRPSGPSLGTSNAPQAVPWAKLKPVSGDKSQPIKLGLNDQQLASLPVFGASKAQETQDTRAAGRKAGATEPPAPGRN
jgi:sporulation protein YlmC with PRC-barrel domain